jgi:hypothetical protein
MRSNKGYRVDFIKPRENYRLKNHTKPLNKQLIMCIFSNLSINDFFPLLGTLITVLTGYTLISIQINKNRRVTWLNEFRQEVAKTLTLLGNKVSNHNIEGETIYPSENRTKIFNNLSLCFNRIELYLNPENEKHQNFLNKLNLVMELVSEREPNSDDQYVFEEALKTLTKSAKELIYDEINKIEKRSIIEQLILRG